jgi:hypothetical protein
VAQRHRDALVREYLRGPVADQGGGKMSGLWSGKPSVLRPEELDAFCAVLGCDISELITAEPEKAPARHRHDVRSNRS